MTSKYLYKTPDVDPHAGVKLFADYSGPVRETCEVVVVGSGPGGAVIAKELADRGMDVILVEEGPPFGTKDFVPEAGESMRNNLREAGLRTARGNGFFPTMQVIGLGGGSLVNSAISIRAPEWALSHWAEDADLPELADGKLDDDFQSIETFLGIAPSDEAILGERNKLFKLGCDRLGYSSEPTPRNVRGCKGSAECFTGCRNGAKQSTDITYVPAAIQKGARVFTSLRIEQVTGSKHHATGVRGRVAEPRTGKMSHEVQIDAKHVVLAAGCMQTPVILMRSGMANSSGQVGENLRGHPGLAAVGMWGHRVAPWEGATQGYQSLHFLKEGMKLEVLWAPPSVLSIRFPGFGLELKQNLSTFERMAPFDVFVHAEHSRGNVRPGPFGGNDPQIFFHVDDRDIALLQQGMVHLAEISFAAGAETVLPGIHGIPDVLHSRDEIRLLSEPKLTATDCTIGMNHVFGTTRMGGNPRTSVVNANGRCHDVDNLYIADTGVFPGSPAVNPMLTCMALARRTARYLGAH